MSVRLVLLGMLTWHNMHGYEIRQLAQSLMGDWTDIKFGSIYFALNKLVEEGHVDIINRTTEGNRPQKTIYAINSSGKDEFIRLLRTAWQQHSRIEYPLDIALFFMSSLPESEIEQYVSLQLETAKAALSHVRMHREELSKQPHIPAVALAIIDHTLCHQEAEILWLSTLEAHIKDLHSSQETTILQGGSQYEAH